MKGLSVRVRGEVSIWSARSLCRCAVTLMGLLSSSAILDTAAMSTSKSTASQGIEVLTVLSALPPVLATPRLPIQPLVPWSTVTFVHLVYCLHRVHLLHLLQPKQESGSWLPDEKTK